MFSEGLQQHRIHTVNPTGPVGIHGVVKKGDYLIEVSLLEFLKDCYYCHLEADWSYE